MLPDGTLSRDPLGGPEIKCDVDTTFNFAGRAERVWIPGRGKIRPAAWMSLDGRRQGQRQPQHPRLLQQAGQAGLARRVRAASVTSPPMPTETQTAQLWICTSCGFVYDPDEGDPDGGIPPGTPFESIPDDWFCPVCGARKSDFEPYEE